MASKRRLRRASEAKQHRMCGNKRGYQQAWQAERQLKDMIIKNLSTKQDRELGVYRCQFCKLWKVGHTFRFKETV